MRTSKRASYIVGRDGVDTQHDLFVDVRLFLGGKEARHFAADHELRDRLAVEHRSRGSLHPLPVAQYRHAVGQFDDFVELVRHEDEARAPVAQLADLPEKEVGLLAG